MSIVIFEDDDMKYEDLKRALMDRGVGELRCKRARTTAECARLLAQEIDLCIVDVMMPNVSGGDVRDAGLEVLSMLSFAGKSRVPVLAITAYLNDLGDQLNKYQERGCIVFDYSDRNSWLGALDVYLTMARDNGRYDFIIFTALKSERDAYGLIPGVTVESVTRYGVDHWDISIGSATGTVILLPRPGIVCASATVAKVLSQYSPKFVAMSGICAGIGDEIALGQLLIMDVCWEYQSGKWLEDAFLSEPYQVSIDINTKSALSKLLENRKMITEAESTYEGDFRPSKKMPPKFAVFATGSAVIASKQRLDQVVLQHRKVSGLDMEVFGFHMAVELSGKHVRAFSAKVVVDKADCQKNDSLHEYGCFISARFVLDALPVLLAER